MRGQKFWIKFHKEFRKRPEYSGFYEGVLKVLAPLLIEDGAIVLDCGANVGKHTLNFARYVGDAGQVIAVEPNPETYRNLCDRVNANVNSHRITPMNLAVGAVDSRISFFANTRRPALSSAIIAQAGPRDHLEEIEVSCRSVDDVFSDIPRLDFVKIDVEGFEFEVFKGARETIEKFRPYVFYENNRQQGVNNGNYEEDEFLGYFRELDYSVHAANGMKLDGNSWLAPGPTNFFAFPREVGVVALEALMLANLENLIDREGN